MMRVKVNSLHMSIVLWIVAHCASAAALDGGKPPSSSGRMYEIPGRGRFSIRAPNSWKDEVRNPDSPPSLKILFRPATGNGFAFLVTALPNSKPPIEVTDSKKMQAFLSESTKDTLTKSVEKQLTLIELKGKAISGYRYTLTDKAPKADEFPLITGGALGGSDFIVAFTILHRDTGEDWTQCIEALRSIEITPLDKKVTAMSNAKAGVADLVRACEKGDGLACGMAAEFSGRLGDKTQMFALSFKGCSLGSAFACATLGALHDNGEGVAKDEALAAKYFNLACEKHSGLGCRNLAAMNFAGRGGLKKDEDKARELTLRACEFGNESACKSYPQAVGAPDDKDGKAYCNFFAKRCSTNDAEACNYAAWCSESGFAGPKDLQLAKTLYEKGCASTSGGACFHLAEQESDSDRAIGLYRKSCDRGYGYACFTLAKRLDARTDRNASEVNGYFRRACEGDVAESCEVLLKLWLE